MRYSTRKAVDFRMMMMVVMGAVVVVQAQARGALDRRNTCRQETDEGNKL